MTRPPGTGLRSVARGGALNLAGAAVSAVLGVGLTVIVTRGFSAAEAGVFFSATSVFVILSTVAKLGTYTGLVYFIARFRALRVPQLVPGVLRTAFLPVIAVSAAGGAALLVWAPEAARLFLPGTGGHVVTYLRVLGVFVPVGVVFDTLLAATRGYRDMRATVLLDRVARPLAQLVFLLPVTFAGSAALLALAWVGPYLPACLVAGLWTARLHRRTITAATDAVADPGRLAAARKESFWRFTAPRSLASVAQIVIQRLDIVLVGALRGAVEAAVYTAASRFLVVGQLGNQSINMAVQPKLSELLAVGDRRGASTLYQTSTAWLVLVSWPLYLLCAVFAPLILRIFGRGYADGVPAVVVLSLVMLLATGCGAVDSVLTMAGRTTWNLYNNLLAVAVNVGVDLLLIPRYGLVGAAVGWAGAIVANNLVPLAQVAWALRLHPVSRASATAAGLALVWFGAVPLAVRATLGAGIVAAVTAVITGGAGYAASLARCGRLLHLQEMPLLGRWARVAGR